MSIIRLPERGLNNALASNLERLVNHIGRLDAPCAITARYRTVKVTPPSAMSTNASHVSSVSPEAGASNRPERSKMGLLRTGPLPPTSEPVPRVGPCIAPSKERMWRVYQEGMEYSLYSTVQRAYLCIEYRVPVPESLRCTMGPRCPLAVHAAQHNIDIARPLVPQTSSAKCRPTSASVDACPLGLEYQSSVFLNALSLYCPCAVTCLSLLFIRINDAITSSICTLLPIELALSANQKTTTLTTRYKYR